MHMPNSPMVLQVSAEPWPTHTCGPETWAQQGAQREVPKQTMTAHNKGLCRRLAEQREHTGWAVDRCRAVRERLVDDWLPVRLTYCLGLNIWSLAGKSGATWDGVSPVEGDGTALWACLYDTLCM